VQAMQSHTIKIAQKLSIHKLNPNPNPNLLKAEGPKLSLTQSYKFQIAKYLTT